MANKIKDALTYMFKNEPKKIKIIVALGLVGILLISCSEMFSQSKDENSADNQSESISSSEYAEETEKKLKKTISSIDGVGDCEVMITFDNTSESVYATDTENKTDSSSESEKDEYVIYDSSSGENPVLIKEKYPTVSGVSVVCDGGDDIKVKESVINTVTALFNISANRVSVSKINNKR